MSTPPPYSNNAVANSNSPAAINSHRLAVQEAEISAQKQEESRQKRFVIYFIMFLMPIVSAVCCIVPARPSASHAKKIWAIVSVLVTLVLAITSIVDRYSVDLTLEALAPVSSVLLGGAYPGIIPWNNMFGWQKVVAVFGGILASLVCVKAVAILSNREKNLDGPLWGFVAKILGWPFTLCRRRKKDKMKLNVKHFGDLPVSLFSEIIAISGRKTAVRG
ncbi:hypothetical protein C8J56DRAFT_1061079 [Mycena floridula]|nr:hypothetical protein C8J56DRAFT_1061079 [Mycena floridula]